MKPLHSDEDLDSNYSKLLEGEESEDDVDEEESEEDDDEDNEEDLNFFNRRNADHQREELKRIDHNLGSSIHSQNGSTSTSAGTLGLYSSFDSMIGGSFSDSDKSYFDSTPQVDEHDISSHLKGALSFGLPSKGSALRIHKPYKLVGRRQKLLLSPRSKKSVKGVSSQRPGNASKADLLRKIEKEMERDNIDHLDENLKVAYRIVMELMGDFLKPHNSIFMETIEMDPSINGDYLEVVKEPIWLPKIKSKLLGQEYKTLTEVVSQIRLMLENTYRYFGANHSFSRRGIRLEYILEQKLTLLPKETRDLCSLETTHGITEEDLKETTRTKSSSITVNGEQYFSYLLYQVKGCRQAREKELKKKRLDLMRQAKVTKENEVVHWDRNLTEGSLGGPYKNMWELVQINQFLFLSMNVLNVNQVSQYEMERILMIPEASLTLRMLMTSLVSSRQQRVKLSEKPYMPYSVWAHRLANKTFHWYRVYSKESRNTMKIFDQLGIEPKFWSVCGEQNPFSKKLFHEMTFYQRVWLFKTLCDYVAHSHKSVQEAIAEQPEENMREILLGKDEAGYEYIYFPQFNGTDVRIYKRFRDKMTVFEDLEEKRERKVKLFTKDQIKAFRKLIKRLKKSRENDEDWESEQQKLKNKLPKKRGRKPGVSSLSSTPSEKRSRPERLRQTPRPRYDVFSMESSLDEDEEYSSKISRKDVDSDSGDDEDVDEKSLEEEEKKEELKEEVRKHFKIGRKKKEKILCKTCGKSFKTKSAMYGHSAMHNRKKDKKPDSEVNEDNKVQDFKVNSEDSEIKEEKYVKDAENFKMEVKSEDAKVIFKEEYLEDEKDVEMRDFDGNAKKDGYAENQSCELVKKELVCDKPTDLNSLENPIASQSCEIEISTLTSQASVEEAKKSTGGENESVESELHKQDGVEKGSEMEDEEKKGVKKQNSEGKSSVKEKWEDDVADDEESRNGINDGSISLNSFLSGNLNQEEPSRSVSPSDDVGDNESSVGIPTPAEPNLKSPVDPDVNEFELVAASFAELRNLILQFGSLPSKYARERVSLQEGDEKEDEGEEEMENEEKKIEASNKDKKDSSKLPKCEQKLHRSLCKLLMEFAPTEGKLNIFHRQVRKKLWNEYLDWSKRDASYVDPSEEAWKSDPEPEPTPSATQTPKQSSSSSSSEDSFNDDGTRKRKLRKRKVKRIQNDPPSPASVSDMRAPSPASASAEDTIAVSSRGRVRKVKRIVNYDRLDFDKLAQQAEKEAEKEKERKKKKKEEDAEREKALQEAAQSLQIPSSGVHRYIISKGGEVVGYIGNDGQVHSGSAKLKEQREIPPRHQQATSSPTKEIKAEQLAESKVPKVVVSAYNEAGTLVYVRMVGTQALELIKLIEASKNTEPRQIKLQRFNQTYTFNTDSPVITQNIPGYPDSDTSNPQFLSKITSRAASSKGISALGNSSKVVSTPQTSHTSQNQQSIVPSVPPVVPVCKSPNPVALAYQGLPATTSNVSEFARQPQSSSCASLSASTRLVYASPSVVPSVPPLTPSGLKLPLSSTSTNSPVIVQTENGQQIQIGLTPDRLSQIVQKTGQRVVAVPNDKGGYTISLISAVNPQGSSSPKSVTDNQSIRPSSQKSVITQLLPTVSSAGGTGQQQISIVKGRLPQSLVSAVPSQQIVPNYTVNSQAINSPVARQVVIQHPGMGTPDVVTSLTQPTQQIVHIAQSPMVQQPQQVYHIQQSNPQKLVQVVHTSGGRQLLLQPGQMLVTNNNINPSVSTLQQPTSVLVHSSQGIHCSKQPSMLQQQVVVQQSQQPTKYQVAHSDQLAQPIQYFQDQTQPKPQHIIIQPQQHYIVQQQQQSSSASTQPTSQTVVIKNAQPQSTDYIQQQEQQIVHTPEQPLMQPISTSKPQSHVTLSKEALQMQQPSGNQQQPKEGATKQQVGRIFVVQMSDGQKVYLQLPDGRLSMLTPEQLQPLIDSGAIKLNS